jgi:hypothetical protein
MTTPPGGDNTISMVAIVKIVMTNRCGQYPVQNQSFTSSGEQQGV